MDHVRDASDIARYDKQTGIETLKYGNRHIVETGRRNHDICLIQIVVYFSIADLSFEFDLSGNTEFHSQGFQRHPQIPISQQNKP